VVATQIFFHATGPETMVLLPGLTAQTTKDEKVNTPVVPIFGTPDD
jgi:hypothetical protein